MAGGDRRTPKGPGAGTARAAPALAGGVPEAVVWLPGGAGFMGTDRPELPQDGEGPRRRTRLAPFGIEACTVTNDRFAAFVAATGYVTEAEEIGWSFLFRAFLPPALAGSPPSVDAASWAGVEGACWQAPEGPGSDLAGRRDHPVVHVSRRDARAFAGWVGGRLPAEAEWEHAARGGGEGRFPWGDREPDDEAFLPCNIWQGRFPERDTGRDGYRGTATVTVFPPNGFGLFQMAGNIREWCEDVSRIRSLSRAARGRTEAARAGAQKVTRGGSYLCHRSSRYRIAARLGLPPDSATGHLGFRVAYSGAGA